MATEAQISRYKELLAAYKKKLAEADEAYYELLGYQSDMTNNHLEGKE